MSGAPEAAPFPAAAIHNATAGKLGLARVDLPGYAHPLWLRAGTADAADCANFLSSFPARLKFDYRPCRILEIGAGAGFRGVALAVAYPAAEILAFEADPVCHRAALLNTLPYRNITFAAEAPGGEPAQFAFTGRNSGNGHVTLAPGHGPVRTTPLPELLRRHGLDHYDTVIFNPDPTSAALLSFDWPQSVRRFAIFTGGGPLPAAARLEAPAFETWQDGKYWFAARRGSVPPYTPSAAAIFDPSGPLGELALVNVSKESWGFFPIGLNGFRLHPNRGTAPGARLILSQNCYNHTRLSTRLCLGHPMSAPVNFSITVTAEPDGTEIFRAQQTLQGGQEQTLTGELGPHSGPCRITFATKMASMASKNDCAWAEFIDPKFE